MIVLADLLAAFPGLGIVTMPPAPGSSIDEDPPGAAFAGLLMGADLPLPAPSIPLPLEKGAPVPPSDSHPDTRVPSNDSNQDGVIQVGQLLPGSMAWAGPEIDADAVAEGRPLPRQFLASEGDARGGSGADSGGTELLRAPFAAVEGEPSLAVESDLASPETEAFAPSRSGEAPASYDPAVQLPEHDGARLIRLGRQLLAEEPLPKGVPIDRSPAVMDFANPLVREWEPQTPADEGVESPAPIRDRGEPTTTSEDRPVGVRDSRPDDIDLFAVRPSERATARTVEPLALARTPGVRSPAPAHAPADPSPTPPSVSVEGTVGVGRTPGNSPLQHSVPEDSKLDLREIVVEVARDSSRQRRGEAPPAATTSPVRERTDAPHSGAWQRESVSRVASPRTRTESGRTRATFALGDTPDGAEPAPLGASATTARLGASDTSAANLSIPSDLTEQARKEVADAVVRIAKDALLDSAGGAKAQIRLQPNSLGPVELEVEIVEDHRVQVVMKVAHDEVRQLLESDVDELVEALAAKKLQLGSFEVRASESSHESGSSPSGEGRDAARSQHESGRGEGRARREDGAESSADDEADDQSPMARRTHQGRVDLSA